MGRFTRRGLMLVVLLCVATLISYHFVDFSITLDYLTDFTENGFGASDYYIRERLHYPQYQYSLTKDFQKHVGNWNTFTEKPQAEKCREFFSFIDKKDPEWAITPLQNVVYDKTVVAKGLYFKNAFQTIKAEKKKEKKQNPDIDPEVVTAEDMKKINGWFHERVNQTEALENKMADLMTVIRSFGHCFFGDSNPLKELKSKFSRKVTAYFDNDLPTFETPDGETHNNKFPGARQYTEEDSIVQYYHENIKGKGVVISASTRYTRDVSRLIRVLRALNNKLPIQIVHRGDILTKSKKLLQGAAVAPIDELMKHYYTDQATVQKVLPEIDLTDPSKYGSEFPIQHLTFVNIERPVKSLGRNYFSNYNNKLLAFMFNTFEEVILVDADAVPLELPYDIFHSPEYKETGAYFFRDRSLKDSNDWIETNYFSKLMPHSHNTIDMALGIKPVTEHTLDAPYMRGWRHTQEAGIVLYNRKRHFSALLAILPLALWGEPVKSSIWGDKEMYWLAMSIVGDEDYSWSKYSAASVGELTKDPSRKIYNVTAASEVCLSHPGHISSSGRILWINSGFSYCKKNGYGRDERRFPFSTFQDKNELKAIYQNPLRVRDAIVPPDLPPLRPRGSPIDLSEEVKYKLELSLRKKDADELPSISQIDSYEPQKGWIKSTCCTNYFYCAYNAIESYDNSGTIDTSGTLVSAAEEDQKRYDFLGKMWVTGIKSMQDFDVVMPPISAYPTYDNDEKYVPETKDSQIRRIDT